MKRRIRRIANFFAFNLLFFALYLNFIHKDKAPSAIPEQSVQATAIARGTVLVDQPEKYLGQNETGTSEVSSNQASH